MITRAQRALAELSRREALDRTMEAETARSQQLHYWHLEDRNAELAAESDLGDDLDFGL
jgi:hypothetical protein